MPDPTQRSKLIRRAYIADQERNDDGTLTVTISEAERQSVRARYMGLSSRFRDVFFAANGFGPWPCFFCNQRVGFDDICVHHVGHDRRDGRPENLKPSHRGCHTAHHSKGRPWSEESREMARKTHTGRPGPRLGMKASPEVRAKISAGNKRAWAERRRHRHGR